MCSCSVGDANSSNTQTHLQAPHLRLFRCIRCFGECNTRLKLRFLRGKRSQDGTYATGECSSGSRGETTFVPRAAARAFMRAPPSSLSSGLCVRHRFQEGCAAEGRFLRLDSRSGRVYGPIRIRCATHCSNSCVGGGRRASEVESDG